MSAQADLLSCPFCGSNAIWVATETKVTGGEEWPRGYIGCVLCGGRTEGHEAESVAVKGWNRRVKN